MQNVKDTATRSPRTCWEPYLRWVVDNRTILLFFLEKKRSHLRKKKINTCGEWLTSAQSVPTIATIIHKQFFLRKKNIWERKKINTCVEKLTIAMIALTMISGLQVSTVVGNWCYKRKQFWGKYGPWVISNWCY